MAFWYMTELDAVIVDTPGIFGTVATSNVIMTEWRYENESLGMTNAMWSFRGLINFQSSGIGATDWHGSIKLCGDGAMELKFNCRGPFDEMGEERPLYSTVVYPVQRNDGVTYWIGADYQGRRITMTRQRTYRLLHNSSRETHTWHALD